MDRKDKIKKAMYKNYKKGDSIKTSQIIQCVKKHYPEIPDNSILPSDFSSNHNNSDPFSGKYPITL